MRGRGLGVRQPRRVAASGIGPDRGSCARRQPPARAKVPGPAHWPGLHAAPAYLAFAASLKNLPTEPESN